jgi:hypothetical protein
MHQVDQKVTTSRRALFAAAPAVALAAPGASMASPETLSSTLQEWVRCRRLQNALNADGNAKAERFDELFALEKRILDAPVRCADDALAVMCAVGLSVERGERTDGADEAAYQRVLAWMGLS